MDRIYNSYRRRKLRESFRPSDVLETTVTNISGIPDSIVRIIDRYKRTYPERLVIVGFYNLSSPYVEHSDLESPGYLLFTAYATLKKDHAGSRGIMLDRYDRRSGDIMLELHKMQTRVLLATALGLYYIPVIGLNRADAVATHNLAVDILAPTIVIYEHPELYRDPRSASEIMFLGDLAGYNVDFIRAHDTMYIFNYTTNAEPIVDYDEDEYEDFAESYRRRMRNRRLHESEMPPIMPNNEPVDARGLRRHDYKAAEYNRYMGPEEPEEDAGGIEEPPHILRRYDPEEYDEYGLLPKDYRARRANESYRRNRIRRRYR